MGALTEIMTRFHEILTQKVGTPVSGQSAIALDNTTVLIKTARYYPNLFSKEKLPLLVATFEEGAPKVQYGRDGDKYILSDTQVVTVYAFLNNITSGSDGTRNTLELAEPIVDAMKATFFARTRLQLDNDTDKLDCLTKDAPMTSHSALNVTEKDVGVIKFSFTIEYEEEITRI